MTFTIITPPEIERVFYEGPLEFREADFEQSGLDKGSPLIKKENKSAEPVVTLGQPQCWNLSHLLREKGQPIPAELALLLPGADFYLVQLACSFRSAKNAQIEWARLTAYLRPKTGQENPIAFDLYPREIYDKNSVSLKIAIAPSLKFAPFGGSLGEAVTNIEFTKLEPVIISHGVLESIPNWDYENTKNYPLRGSKFGYLIVKKPHSAEAVRLTLDIVADVVTRHGLLSARVVEKDRANLTQVICSD
jgi:hypothetical protein